MRLLTQIVTTHHVGRHLETFLNCLRQRLSEPSDFIVKIWEFLNLSKSKIEVVCFMGGTIF